ncbi:MAG: hypothetical protein E6J83_08355 [Deltaproteobacteria bacterium]|nr:MAG: hypothetical protein E6J83_08355 [Deltaproteobacteria bacterium]
MTRVEWVGLVAATGVALGLAAITMVPRGAGRQEAGSSPRGVASRDEPEFSSGIPGLKMADVRDYKLLWREIEELQQWELGDRISVAEYRSKTIEKTADFLGLAGSAANRFTTVASDTLASIRESFFRRGRVDADPQVAEAEFYSGMRGGVTRVTSLLGEEPRHRLFAPDCKKWLLQLAFGGRATP